MLSGGLHLLLNKLNVVISGKSFGYGEVYCLFLLIFNSSLCYLLLYHYPFMAFPASYTAMSKSNSCIVSNSRESLEMEVRFLCVPRYSRWQLGDRGGKWLARCNAEPWKEETE